jgi:integration host factor subunit beta
MGTVAEPPPQGRVSPDKTFEIVGDERGVMTKADLIDEVSRLAELTRKDSEVIVETIFDSVVRSLRAGDKIEIRGFGSFRTRQRRPRVGRNPKTGERVEVPAKKIPFFKPSKELKDLVNETTPAAAPAASAPPASAPPTA